jgi:hypothetical protein
MRDGTDRRPEAVPDDEAASDGTALDETAADVRGGADTDGDRHPDTLLTTDGADLLVLTDLDGDGLADRVLRIGPDGSVHPTAGHLTAGHPIVTPTDVELDGPASGTGSAPAHGPWSALLSHLLGPDP